MSVERQTEVTQGGWGKEEPSPQTGQPSSGPVDLSRVRVGCMGRARPKAYPVLGEEPCRDTAYVLGMAGPAWCSRCGPPEQEGKEWGWGRGGKRMRRSRKNRVQEGEKRGERRRKTVGKDGQIDRQTAHRGRLTRPPLHSHPAPQTQLLAPGLSFTGVGKDGPTNHTSRQPWGLRFCPIRGASLCLDTYFSPLPESAHGEETKEGKHGALQGGCQATCEGSLWGPGVRVEEGRQVGTHQSAWSPGRRPSTTSPSSAAQAGAWCAATAAADDLELPLRTISPLQELLDELL